MLFLEEVLNETRKRKRHLEQRIKNSARRISAIKIELAKEQGKLETLEDDSYDLADIIIMIEEHEEQ